MPPYLVYDILWHAYCIICIILVVAIFVFNLKVTRRLRNIQYFVERHVMKVKADVRPTENAMKELELLSKVK